jgi:hypothetical protein
VVVLVCLVIALELHKQEEQTLVAVEVLAEMLVPQQALVVVQVTV